MIAPSFFALAFYYVLEYRYLNARINSGDDASTSCENVMNSGLVMQEKTRLICELLYLHWAKLAYPFVVLAFENALGYCNINGRIKSGNDTPT